MPLKNIDVECLKRKKYNKIRLHQNEMELLLHLLRDFLPLLFSIPFMKTYT